MPRRILWLHSLWGGLLIAITIRLLILMLSPDTLVKGSSQGGWLGRANIRAAMEHLHLVQVDDGRGRILFQNGCPWSGTKQITQLADLSYGATMTHKEFGPTTDGGVVGKLGKPDRWPSPTHSVAEIGRSGLEYEFDSILGSQHAAYLGVVKDADGRLHQSLGLFSMKSSPGADLRTTIDSAWQRRMTAIIQKVHAKKVSVVVVDTETNNLLAIASKFAGDSRELVAVHAEIPGSVFKLVTAAAALEDAKVRPTSSFYCSGTSPLKGVHMKCWKRHGEETFESAIANSCDVVFARVGVEVGRDVLAKMSERLGVPSTGLQTHNGRSVLPEAENGRVFKRDGRDNGLLANTAIGQEDVRLNPVQAALLASTVANRGMYRPARLVMDAESEGRVRLAYTNVGWTRAYSTFTAEKLTQAMRAAVTLPTGTAYGVDDGLPEAAIKTGTAELRPSRQQLVNGWMVGFAPYQHPKIAFSVFVGDEASSVAHPLVRQIVREVLSTYKQFQGGTIIS